MYICNQTLKNFNSYDSYTITKSKFVCTFRVCSVTAYFGTSFHSLTGIVVSLRGKTMGKTHEKQMHIYNCTSLAPPRPSRVYFLSLNDDARYVIFCRQNILQLCNFLQRQAKSSQQISTAFHAKCLFYVFAVRQLEVL